MSEIGLGRLPSKDVRDHQYLIPVRRKAASVVTQKTWYSGGVMDQGATSQCVAYSGVKYLTSGPVYNKPLDPVELYRECLKLDEWPGEDFDGGTSVRALFKALKGRGLVTEYRWAFELEPVVNHVLTTGPVVMGTVWTYDMFMPHNVNGYIWPTGSVEGGHAWLIIGANRNRRNPDGSKGAFRMVNSWGDDWGQNGRAWLSFETLAYLIKQDGEAAVATEVVKK